MICSHCCETRLSSDVCSMCRNTYKAAAFKARCFRSVTKHAMTFFILRYWSGRCSMWCHLGMVTGYSRLYRRWCLPINVVSRSMCFTASVPPHLSKPLMSTSSSQH